MYIHIYIYIYTSMQIWSIQVLHGSLASHWQHWLPLVWREMGARQQTRVELRIHLWSDTRAMMGNQKFWGFQRLRARLVRCRANVPDTHHTTVCVDWFSADVFRISWLASAHRGSMYACAYLCMHILKFDLRFKRKILSCLVKTDKLCNVESMFVCDPPCQNYFDIEYYL